MKYYVIGAGSIGQRHYRNLVALGADAKIVGYRSADLANTIREISSFKEQAGVVIATSTSIRVPLLLQCAQNGAALYIEKPVAYKVAELEKILGLPRDVQQRSVAGFMMRYHPLVEKLIEYRDESFYRAHFEVAHDVRKWRKDWNFASSYASQPLGGGVLLDLCHELDLSTLICGATNVDYVGCLADHAYKDVDLSTQIHCSSDHGTQSLISMDYLSPSLFRRGVLHGLSQRIEYDLVAGTIQLTHGPKRRCFEFDVDRNQMFLDLMSDFMALVEGKPPKSKYVPRLDLVKGVCRMICDAWAKREFLATIQSGLGSQ